MTDTVTEQGADEWFVARDGNPIGPYKLADLRRRLARGEVRPNELVCARGEDEWLAAKDHPRLSDVYTLPAVDVEHGATAPKPDGTVDCPHCGGEIKAAAKLCKHCKRSVAVDDGLPRPSGKAAASFKPGDGPVLPRAPSSTPSLPRVATHPPLVALARSDRSAVITPLKAFVVGRGLVPASEFDRVLAETAPGDAAVMLGHLAAHGLLTSAQLDATREGFRQAQLASAGQVLQAATVQGLLDHTQAQQALADYQHVALEQTVFDFIASQHLLTASQLNEIRERTTKPTKAWFASLRTRWREVPKPFRWFAFAVAGAMGLSVLAAVAGAIRGTPDVRDSCVMDGFGVGSCAFTNRGTRTGSVCGHITVECGARTRSGPSFCSGSVEPHETKNVSYVVTGVNDIRPFRRVDWREECSFDFYRENVGE